MATAFDVYSQLCDVVVMCHRPLKDYTIQHGVPLIPLAGVPLIVRCLAPWVASGFRRFYIVHYDERVLAAIRNGFPEQLVGDRPLQLILVQVTSDPLSEKEALRKVSAKREGANKSRDLVITDCTTLLSKEDVIPFMTNFYSSFASGSLLLWKAFVAEKNAPKKGAGGKGSKEAEEVVASENLVLAGLEEECAGEVIIGGSTQPDVAHYRVHYLATAEANAVPQLQMGFVARRPNLEFRYDLNDSGVYAMQSWLFDFVTSDFEGEGISATIRDALYLIAPGQHWKINRRPQCVSAVSAPADAIKELLQDSSQENGLTGCMTAHWALGNQVLGPVTRTPNLSYYGKQFNAMQDILPSSWDTFRLVTTVVADKKCDGRRVMTINRASDLALATADVATGLHFQVANATMKVAHPRSVCDDLYICLLASFVDDLKFKRGSAAQSNLKNSIVLCDSKTNIGKGTFTEGTFIAETAKIGDKVSLLNCVVLDGATVSNGAKLSHCVVKSGATVVERNDKGEVSAVTATGRAFE